MQAEWIKIFGAAQLFLVEIQKGMLAENKIESVLVNKTDSMNLFLTNGEVELYVKKEDALKARHLIKNNQFE